MRKLIVLLTAITLVSACKEETKKEDAIKLESQKDRLSYAFGADNGHAIANSGDPHYAKYDLDKITAGFTIGMKDANSFDEDCQSTLRKLYGETGRDFNEEFADKGCECLGRLSGVIFLNTWKKKGGLEFFDEKMVVAGFKASLNKADTIVSRQDQMELISNFIEDMNQKNGAKLLASAAEKPNTINVDGLIVETILEGKGKSPMETDKVQANYILMNAVGDTMENSFVYELQSGKQIDPFQLDQVIPGWTIGMQKMKEGGKYKLYIPYNLAYGAQGIFNQQRNAYDIQPYETLQFYVELNKVIKD